jgi:hypothetical protein
MLRVPQLWLAGVILLAATPAIGLTLTTGTDTYVREAAAGTSHGGGARVEWDGSDGGGENHALLYMPIFQSEGGPVDPAAVLAAPNFAARLRLNVANEGDGGQLHRLNQGFAENETWNGMPGGAGVQPGVNAAAAPDATTPDMGVGVHTIDVTASILQWAASPAGNFGWGILPTGGNGLELSSFESGNGAELVMGDFTDYVTPGALGTSWSFYDQIVAPDPSYPTDGSGRDWRELAFDDSGWGSGAGQLGYGDGDETTTVAANEITYLFRTTFLVGDRPDQLLLDLLRDDAAIVYLNGVEVLRDNLPAGAIDAATPSSATGTDNLLSSFDLDPSLLLANQLNVLAVEIHNASTSSSDVSFDLALMGVDDGIFSPVPEPNALALWAGLLTLLIRLSRPSSAAWPRCRAG